MKSFKLSGEKLVNLCLFIASGFYLYYTLGHYQVGTVKSPGEGFLPLILGAGSVVIGAVLTVQAFCGKGDAKDVHIAISWLRFALLTGVCLAYALTLETVGYLLGSFLFLFIVLKVAKVKGWLAPLLISLGTSAAFYLIFKVTLGVMLPRGFIGL